MRGQVRGDEEETRAEYHEGDRHRALRPKRRAGPRREAVLLRDGAEPDQISPQEQREVEGAEVAAGEQHVRRAEGLLQGRLPLVSLGAGLLRAYGQQVGNGLYVARQHEVVQFLRRILTVHVPRADEDFQLAIRQYLLKLHRSEQGVGGDSPVKEVSAKRREEEKNGSPREPLKNLFGKKRKIYLSRAF